MGIVGQNLLVVCKVSGSIPNRDFYGDLELIIVILALRTLRQKVLSLRPAWTICSRASSKS